MNLDLLETGMPKSAPPSRTITDFLDAYATTIPPIVSEVVQKHKYLLHTPIGFIVTMKPKRDPILHLLRVASFMEVSHATENHFREHRRSCD
jgi:hypothetical protein